MPISTSREKIDEVMAALQDPCAYILIISAPNSFVIKREMRGVADMRALGLAERPDEQGRPPSVDTLIRRGRALGRLVRDVAGACEREGSPLSADALIRAAQDQGLTWVDWRPAMAKLPLGAEGLRRMREMLDLPSASERYTLPSDLAERLGLVASKTTAETVPAAVYAAMAAQWGARSSHAGNTLPKACFSEQRRHQLIKSGLRFSPDRRPGATPVAEQARLEAALRDLRLTNRRAIRQLNEKMAALGGDGMKVELERLGWHKALLCDDASVAGRAADALAGDSRLSYRDCQSERFFRAKFESWLQWRLSDMRAGNVDAHATAAAALDDLRKGRLWAHQDGVMSTPHAASVMGALRLRSARALAEALDIDIDEGDFGGARDERGDTPRDATPSHPVVS